MNRIARFVAAARTLMLLQVLAALLAVVIAAWAFTEVRGMAEERDRLKARVAELEAAQGSGLLPPGSAVPIEPEPAFNQMLPPGPPADYNAILPAPIVAPEVNGLAPAVPVAPILPVAPPPARAAEPDEAEPELKEAPRRWDCSGLNAQQPRCRPLMERPNLPLNELEPRGPALGPREGAGGNQAQ